MGQLELWFESGVTSLSVREFLARESVSELFTVSVMARSRDPSIDLEAIVGRPAALALAGGVQFSTLHLKRRWLGVCSHIELLRVETSQKGESTYALEIVPSLWLLGQRRDHRIFQHLAVPDIVDKVLGETVKHTWKIDRGAYPKLEYRVQHGESDLAFVCRLLEEAGIAYTFPDHDGAGSVLTFDDNLTGGDPLAGSPLVFVDTPTRDDERPYVTGVQMRHSVRPGAYTLRDHDFRRPDFTLQGEAPKAKGPEAQLEQYRYRQGAVLVENGKGGDTPVADDKGVARHDERFATQRATRALQAERHEKRRVLFATNSMILAPGALFAIDKHPHHGLSGQELLITEFSVQGTASTSWEMTGKAVFAAEPYRPPEVTPRPDLKGIEAAVVVGPPGEEISTDEFGRVRVQFPWDREGKRDDDSSCWMRVSQGWAGTGFGAIAVPRVGQEVLVSFLGGDPDQPIVVGRVFNARNVVPYKLPEHKTRSTWKSSSSPGGDGFNEIMFEDQKGKELVYVQAQRDAHKLVKNDESERTTGHHRRLVGKDQDLVVKGIKKERLEGDSHLLVSGARSTRVKGQESLTVQGSRHEKVDGRYAVEGGGEIHVSAGESLIIKGPGGFIKIDEMGITIQGTMVRINCGDVDLGMGPTPTEPSPAAEPGDEGAP